MPRLSDHIPTSRLPTPPTEDPALAGRREFLAEFARRLEEAFPPDNKPTPGTDAFDEAWEEER